MDPSTSSAPLLEEDFFVGVWLVQPRLNQVSSGEIVHEIEPKVMRVLVCLARQPGAVISHAELMETVWPGIIVGEKSLAGAISKLRKVFDDDPYDPRVIKTVSKQGYRLIAPVTPRVPAERVAGSYGGDNAPEVVVNVPPAMARVPSKRMWFQGWPAMAVLAGLILIGGSLVWGLPSTTRRAAAPAPAIPLTSYPGHEINPALAPGGVCLDGG